MFSIGTPIVRLIKTPKCKDIKRNAFLWCRVTEKNSGTGAKIFDEKVVGPEYRFMMEILSDVKGFKIFGKRNDEKCPKQQQGERIPIPLLPCATCRHGHFLRFMLGLEVTRKTI